MSKTKGKTQKRSFPKKSTRFKSPGIAPLAVIVTDFERERPQTLHHVSALPSEDAEATLAGSGAVGTAHLPPGMGLFIGEADEISAKFKGHVTFVSRQSKSGSCNERDMGSGG